MFDRIKNLFTNKKASIEPKQERLSVFSTDLKTPDDYENILDKVNSRVFTKTGMDHLAKSSGHAMDSAVGSSIKSQFLLGSQTISTPVLDWFASQSFIGFQTAALLAQQWLIDRACTMPGDDAIRKGYEITINDGNDVAPEILEEIKNADIRYKLNHHLKQFEKMNRVFGIRIAMFLVDTPDPADYYSKPFNPDGIRPGSYKGICQIDPYWITPELDAESAANPASLHFYEPTWWRVNTWRVHRSHLVIITNGEVADILKPSYTYAGISVPQKIYERVYAAERTANEAPELALTKRTSVIKVDIAQAVAKQTDFEARMRMMSFLRNNYAYNTIDHDDEMTQFDTTLTDLDAVIMTQYQIVAAAAEVPAVKLLGTSPKGFNATGEYEERNYHELLESIQTHHLTPLIERHWLLLIRSEILPMFAGQVDFIATPKWNSVNTIGAKEQSEINQINAAAGAQLIASGAIDATEERDRIIADKNSGYNGLEPIEELEEDPIDTNNEEFPGDDDEEITN
jgi:phage-related protein (TIGR01555 family)